MPDINWINVSSVAIGILGAAVAAITLYTTRRDRRQRVIVKVRYGLLLPGPSPLMLFIQASNPGDRTVNVTSLGISLPRKKQVDFPDPQGDVRFPHDLPEGKSCSVWIEARILAQTLKAEGYAGKIKIRGFARSGIGAMYQSRRCEINVDDWSKLP